MPAIKTEKAPCFPFLGRSSAQWLMLSLLSVSISCSFTATPPALSAAAVIDDTLRACNATRPDPSPGTIDLLVASGSPGDPVIGGSDAAIATSQKRNDAAIRFAESGKYAAAREEFEGALAIVERVRGPKHTQTAELQHNVASFYVNIGQLERAESLYCKALAVQMIAFGPRSLQTERTLSALAYIYELRFQFRKARALLEYSLEVRLQKLGRFHRDTAQSLERVGEIQWSMGDHKRARTLMEEALHILETVQQPGDLSRLAIRRNNLAHLYAQLNEYQRAEQFYRQALAEAENPVGPDHALARASSSGLARLLIDLGRRIEAKEFARKIESSFALEMAEILSFGTEEQRLSYQHRRDPYSIVATLGDVEGIAQAVLRFKGLVLDSVLEDRKLAAAVNRLPGNNLFDERSRLKQQLLRMTLRGVREGDEQRDALVRRLEDLEGRLFRHGMSLHRGRRALEVTREDVQRRLDDRTVLVEFLLYRHYLGREKYENRYGAVVLARSRGPSWVALGPASRVDAAVEQYQMAMRFPATAARVDDLLRDLHAKLWLPIQAELPASAEHIILSPDGPLNLLSFATLRDPSGSFMGQRYDVTYVSSGRDILNEVQISASNNALIFSNPDFRLEPGKDFATARTTRGASDIELIDIPMTGVEAKLVAEKLHGWSWSVTSLESSEATEIHLRHARAPRILHLATHGVYLPDPEARSSQTDDPNERAAEEEPRPSTHPPHRPATLMEPMDRSFLALAGGQQTLDAWKHGEIFDTDTDGILIATEVPELQLDGTWLVALSACDSGSGDVRSGEGVMGLRRGFMEAGAANLLTTLWSIPDTPETAAFVADFYAALDEGRSEPGRALAQTQREWVARARNDRDLASTVGLVGAFVVSSQGSPVSKRADP